jgi:hypothetical protein
VVYAVDMKVNVLIVVVYGLLVISAGVYTYQKGTPDAKPFTMRGDTKVVCGDIKVAHDTHIDRVFARGAQRDCGIYQ